MPRTINQGFLDFLPKLTPSTVESSNVQSHRASIEACLKSNFGLNRFVRIGSFGNGTSISGHSDVDYLASLPKTNFTSNSGTVLTKVKDALARRYPTTAVRVNCPAISVPFGTARAEHTEVVPADYMETKDGYHVYDIADCSGSWMRSSPDAHNAYVREIDTKLGGKVKPLIRFIKAWKYYNDVPISSFYLELRVAKYASAETSIQYDYDVRGVFKMLSDCELTRLQDPKGISGYISPCSTEERRKTALSKLSTALTRADKARSAAKAENVKEAFGWWDLVFAGNFPSYVN